MYTFKSFHLDTLIFGEKWYGYSKLYTGIVGEDCSTLLTSTQQVKLAISIRSDNISKQTQIEYSNTAYENFTEALHFSAMGPLK